MTKRTLESLSWYQRAAIRRDYYFRHEKAHVYRDARTALCGVEYPPVYVASEHAQKPENNVCAECARLAAEQS